MGGSKHRDTPDNLIALCRPCHHEADFGTVLPKEKLKEIVNATLQNQRR
jgi:5-methylcytosine-specific restriction endonuclease McrA